MILGVCGKREHGKDTFARMLIEVDPSFSRLGFADRLKEICMKVYDLTEEQVSDFRAKEASLDQPIDLDARLDLLRAETGLLLFEQRLVANTPRQVLQYVGTDYIRSVQPDYWLQVVAQKIKENPDGNYVITDVRFPNEAEILKGLGAFILKVLRLSKLPDNSMAEHASEQINFKSDATLAVMEDDFSLTKLIVSASKNKGLVDMLSFFDWDKVSVLLPLAVSYYLPQSVVNTTSQPELQATK